MNPLYFFAQTLNLLQICQAINAFTIELQHDLLVFLRTLSNKYKKAFYCKSDTNEIQLHNHSKKNISASIVSWLRC